MTGFEKTRQLAGYTSAAIIVLKDYAGKSNLNQTEQVQAVTKITRLTDLTRTKGAAVLELTADYLNKLNEIIVK